MDMLVPFQTNAADYADDALVDCSFRVPLSEEGLYYCRHSQVQTQYEMVNRTICRFCDKHYQPCRRPRRDISPGLTIEELKIQRQLQRVMEQEFQKVPAFSHVCCHLGSIVDHQLCVEDFLENIPIHQCHSGMDKCVLSARESRLLKDHGVEIQSCEMCPISDYTPRYVTTTQLARDVRRLMSILPPDITHIIGVARSGLLVASMIAIDLHLPLSIVRQSDRDTISAGNGWRLDSPDVQPTGRTLVVDDTVMMGNSMKDVTDLVQEEFGEVLTAAVYANPLSRFRPDYVAVDLPWPHLLEWNLFNSVLVPQCAFDLDGVLCQDCPEGDDDDGPRYLQFLEHAQPLHLVRRQPIPLIITARLEKYRHHTEDWLSRWGIRFQKLVMGPWKSHAERAKHDISQFKAHHFQEFIGPKRRRNPRFYVESEPQQAKRIAALTTGVVICPPAGRCYL